MNPMPDQVEPASVTFETKVWEQDWKVVLDRERLSAQISAHEFPFAARAVIVNNVDDVARVVRRCRHLIDAGILDRVTVVDEHLDATLTRLGLSRDSFGRGYVYSVAELVGIATCTTEYLLHMSGDTTLAAPAAWIPPTIDLMRNDPGVVTATVVWNGLMHEVDAEADWSDDTFSYGFGFSDQLYLIRREQFAQPIYGFSHPASERYPAYGGELFEKRVDSWMRTHDLRRAVFRGASYRHENIRVAPPLAKRVLRRLSRRKVT